MGTTLTGTTPQDTYDSLIKVTDNGPISGTLKALSDGLGNDSTLSLSTTAASIAGTLAVTGNATFDTSTLVVDAANNRVGVGVASPSHVLDIQSTAPTLRIRNTTAPNAGGTSSLLFEGLNDFSGVSQSFINSIQAGNSGATQLAFGTGSTGSATGTERMRIDSAGNVGIGTSTPTAGYKLDLRGRAITYNSGYIADFISTESNASSIQLYADNTQASIVQGGTSTVPLTFFVGGTEKMRIQTGGGISFNGDTAAANALDDYEEGTWTMGISFGGASVGVTTSNNTGTYTKIGRQVTVNGLIELTNKGTSTGLAAVSGLPFPVGSLVANYGAASVYLSNITFLGQFMAFAISSESRIRLRDVSSLGVIADLNEANFANNSTIMVNYTYFV